MNTDADGLPLLADRQRFLSAFRAVMAERWPDARPDVAATVGAFAACRFFGVRFRPEANRDRAWVARRPNPDVFEVWDPAAEFLWDFIGRLPEPALYQPDEAGDARLRAASEAAMARITVMARLVHAAAAGIEPDSDD